MRMTGLCDCGYPATNDEGTKCRGCETARERAIARLAAMPTYEYRARKMAQFGLSTCGVEDAIAMHDELVEWERLAAS